MARPKKNTVDYFPHSCTHKKTLFIIDQKYGNDGYSFWFKLLELLGSTPGHYLSYQEENEEDWEFLQAITHFSNDKCNEILNLLSKLNAIDPELWEKRIVWSQNFVDGIKDVYNNRRVEIPQKPSFYIEKQEQTKVSTDENSENPNNHPVSTDENRQSKVKKSKVKYKEKIYKKEKSEISDRKTKFIQDVHKVVFTNPKYKPVKDAFIRYWTELNKSKTKMRFEAEQYFEIPKRLSTFLQNESKFKKAVNGYETYREEGKNYDW